MIDSSQLKANTGLWVFYSGAQNHTDANAGLKTRRDDVQQFTTDSLNKPKQQNGFFLLFSGDVAVTLSLGQHWKTTQGSWAND